MLLTITATRRPAKDPGYPVRFLAVGMEHEKLGAPTQMAIFDAAK